MVLFPNAKINIGLNILNKRDDGYHNIETLFYPIGLQDALEYVVNGLNQVRFNSTGLALNINPEQNIVFKAYRMMQDEYSLPGVDIHLHKIIPSGAGLGGGSADAAFFLRSLDEYFDLNISPDKLKSLAGRLGADCPFFLLNKPAYATETGDNLLPVDLSLKGYYLLLVKPPFEIDTKTAYSGVNPQAFPYDFPGIICGKAEEWKDRIKNDFEPSLFQQFPELGFIKNKLSSMGATYVSLSGSGSSVYAIYDHNPAFSEVDFPPGSFIWKEQLY
jgi:4-diphosphocytidyl-2-C-methyl-D-erythritol kinase